MWSWSTAAEFIRQLAGSRALEASAMLRGSAFFGWQRRWTRMLSISRARAFASSLVRSRNEGPEGQGGPAPDLADLLARS